MPAPVQSAPAPSLETLEAVAVQPQPAQPTAPAQSNAQPDAQPTTQVRLPVEPAPALSSQTMADLPVADGAANLSAPVQSAPAPSLETLEAVAVQPQPAQPTAPAQPGTHDTQATTQVRLPVEPASALSPQTMADLPVADSAANLPAPAPSVPAPAPSLETLEAAAVQPQPTAPAQPTTQVRLPVEPAPALNSQTMADLSVVDGAANLPAPAPSAPAPSLETVAVQPQPAQSTALAQPGAQPDTQATTQVRLPVEPAPTLSINAQVMNELLAKEKAASTNYIASKSGELAFPSSPTLQRQVMPTVQASSSTGSFSAATLPLPTIFPHTQPLVLPTASSLPLEALATPANELAPTAPLETTATQPLATTQPMAQPMAQPRLTVEAALVPAGNTEAMASPLTEETVATQNKHAASQNSGVVAPVSLSPQQPVLPNSPATISLGTPVTSPSWPSQLGQQLVQFTQRGGEHQIKMQLHPAELGPLSISLKVSEQGTQAHFLTASAQARQVIELAIPQLREALAEQGISLGETSVGEQGTSGEQLFAQQESGTSRNLGSNDDREGDATATLDMSDSGSLALDGRIDLYA
ncbi:MAG: flagellar hook-length control protein FliK, partial [Halomonas sp.]